jgi:hypothetical protein
MISAHPTGFGITFLLIAVLAHFASQRFSPVEFRSNFEVAGLP